MGQQRPLDPGQRASSGRKGESSDSRVQRLGGRTCRRGQMRIPRDVADAECCTRAASNRERAWWWSPSDAGTRGRRRLSSRANTIHTNEAALARFRQAPAATPSRFFVADIPQRSRDRQVIAPSTPGTRRHDGARYRLCGQPVSGQLGRCVIQPLHDTSIPALTTEPAASQMNHGCMTRSYGVAMVSAAWGDSPQPS
jgi:hypothetical protein